MHIQCLEIVITYCRGSQVQVSKVMLRVTVKGSSEYVVSEKVASPPT